MFRLLLPLGLLTACSKEKDTSSPCKGGSWGRIADPEATVHVAEEGDDAGTGTQDDPVASLSAALTLARASGSPIFVGPGSYETAGVDLAHLASDGGSDDGLVVQGCTNESELVGDDDTFILRISEAVDLVLVGLNLQGGERPLQIQQGAGVTLKDILLEAPTRVGIVIDGFATEAVLQNVEVHDVQPGVSTSGTPIAYGMGVRQANISMEGGGIWEAIGAGIVLSGSALDAAHSNYVLKDVTVEGVERLDDGSLGRGIHVQSAVSLDLSGAMISDVYDAGVFVLQTSSATVEGVEVREVGSAELDDGTGTGDGIVVTAETAEGMSGSADDYEATISTNLVDGMPRVGIAVESVSASLSGNRAMGDDGDLIWTGEATLSGSDTLEELDLEFNRALLEDEDLVKSDY